jgi:hypothetical protein
MHKKYTVMFSWGNKKLFFGKTPSLFLDNFLAMRA